MVVTIVLGALTAGCGLLTPSGAAPPCVPNADVACTIIDGYPVGTLTRDCGEDGVSCGKIELLARMALDAREPGHPATTAVRQFEPDLARVCGPVLCAFSSQQTIVVFTFVDGSHAATGYQCPGVNPCVGTLTWNGWGTAVHLPGQ